MNAHYILVNNVESSHLRKVIQDMSNLYVDVVFSRGIILHKSLEKETFLITFDNQPDLDRFSYFVNYIQYPIGFDLEFFKPTVTGYFNTEENEKVYEFEVKDWLLVYNPETDNEYDNVYLVNELDNKFKLDFGGNITKIDNGKIHFSKEPVEMSSFALIETFDPKLELKDSKKGIDKKPNSALKAKDTDKAIAINENQRLVERPVKGIKSKPWWKFW